MKKLPTDKELFNWFCENRVREMEKEWAWFKENRASLSYAVEHEGWSVWRRKGLIHQLPVKDPREAIQLAMKRQKEEK